MTTARRAFLVAALSILVAGSVLAGLFILGKSAPSDKAIDVPGGRRSAIASCRDFQRFTAATRSGASANEVFDILRSGQTEADRALDQDPHWVRLASAVTTMRFALEHDDPEASRTSLQIARAMCAELNITL